MENTDRMTQRTAKKREFDSLATDEKQGPKGHLLLAEMRELDRKIKFRADLIRLILHT